MQPLYSFIIPYYHRPKQFNETLCSYVHFYCSSGRKCYQQMQLIVVLDAYNMNKTQVECVYSLLDAFAPLFDIKVLLYSKQNHNPAPLYNLGAKEADGKYLVLTNPECRHEVDILSFFDKLFDGQDKYVVASCMALREDGSFLKWYHHSIYRPTYFHFCSALPSSLFHKVGGFCEEYALGYCFEDNDFRDRMNRYIVAEDRAMVSHLWHKKNKPSNWRGLWERNRKLYERRRNSGFN